uniref:Uncharacterized protein n=1 Tax=Strongyloides stercoralis TaxID=6248 RepID=A0AAF5CUL6_STRER
MKKILRRTNTKEVSNDKSKNRKQNETEYLSVNVGTKMTNEESIEKENKKISTSSESELQKSSLKKGKLSKDSKNGNKAADNKKQSTNLENLKDKSTTSNEEISNEIENNKDKILLPINFEDIGVENRFDRLEKSIIEIFTPLNGVRHSLVYSLICLILIYILTIILTYTPLFINDPMLRQQYRGCNSLCEFKRRKELELNYLKNDVEKWKENHSAVIAEYFIYKHELLNQEKKNIKK